MPVLVAAVVVIGLLCVIDLLLTLGTIRRLREHTDLLTRLASALDGTATRARSDPKPMVGTEIGPFTAVTTAGEILDAAALPADTLIAFFDPGCAPCEDLRPDFLRYAAGRPGGRDRVVAVVNARPDEVVPPGRIAELDAVARVVVGPAAEAVRTAFDVHGWPTLCTVADGRITASGTDLAALRTPAGV